MSLVMKKITKILLLFLVIFAGCAPSYADTDYKCLRDCNNSSTSNVSKVTPAACLKSCTYVAEGARKKSARASKNSARNRYNEFSEQYKGGGLAAPEAKTSTVEPAKNYQCLSSCLKDGLQYQLCQTRCTTR